MAPNDPKPLASNLITIDKDSLAAMINEAVAARMAEATAEASAAASERAPGLDMQLLGDAIAAGIAKNSPARKVTFGQYDPHSSFQQGRTIKEMPKLRRECYQNGFRLMATAQAGEIDLLNKITHSGRYVNRLVEVVVSDEGADETVEIRWNCKTADQRNALKDHARNFTEILQLIVDAQAEERKEDAARKERGEVRRHFGSGQNTREARERAGVA